VQATQVYRVREERYQPFLLAAILLLAAERLIPRRRGHWRAVRDRLRAEPPRLVLPRPPAWIGAPLRRLGRRRAGAAGAAVLLAGLFAATPAAADYRGHLRRGNRHFKAERVEEARQEYFNAQSDRPEAPEAPYNIGNTYLTEGKWDDAIRSFDQAATLAKHPLMKSLAAYNKGCALFGAGREEDAIAAFKESLRWNPADADAKYNIEWIRSPKRPKQPKGGAGEPKQGPKPRPDQLSREDAERVLEMVRDQEKRRREEENRRRKKDAERGGGRDW
jgi:tetratricopeptide (TPR) repeat protein